MKPGANPTKQFVLIFAVKLVCFLHLERMHYIVIEKVHSLTEKNPEKIIVNEEKKVW